MGLDELHRVFAMSVCVSEAPGGAKYLGQIPSGHCLVRLYEVEGKYYHVVRYQED